MQKVKNPDIIAFLRNLAGLKFEVEKEDMSGEKSTYGNSILAKTLRVCCHHL